MIRAPGLNTVANAARTAAQLLRRCDPFADAIGGVAAAANGKAPATPLPLRDLSSGSLLLRSCARERDGLRIAADAGDAARHAGHLARLGELLRFAKALEKLGGVRPRILRGRFMDKLTGWYTDGVRQGVEKGLVDAKATNCVPAAILVHIKLEESVAVLSNRLDQDTMAYNRALQKGLGGTETMWLNDDDLVGLTDDMKSIWASRMGSAAVWRNSRYKVPVGRDSMDKVGAFCQNPATREKMFESYYRGFGTEVDETALALLRTRKELAQKLGFASWAECELRPLAVSDVAGARRLMDKCWQDAQPALKPFLKKMEALAEASKQQRQAGGRAVADKRQAAPGSPRFGHADEQFLRSLITREADTWKLAEFFPPACLPGLFDVVGRSYNVSFIEVDKPETIPRLISGWHKSVRIYEVRDGSDTASLSGQAISSRRLLGYVYLDLFQRVSILGRPHVALAGALALCKGHAYINMNLQSPGLGQNKLFSPEELTGIAHELGHAVHMLCHGGSTQDFDGLPLDVKELPSTLAETIVLQPGAMEQYARHYSSGGPPPEALIRSCQRNVFFFTRYMQSANVSLGLHSESFDPHTSTAAELRQAATGLWQRYSPVPAHPNFHPLGEDAGVYLGQGANQFAYILCYLRVDEILHAGQRGVPNVGTKATRSGDAARKWLNPSFSGRIRERLLDPAFDPGRLAALLPALKDEGATATDAPKHPFGALPRDSSGMFSRGKVAPAPLSLKM